MITASCSVTVKDVTPPLKLPNRFSQSGPAVLSNRWWLEFNDSELNQLIDQALSNNFNLISVFNRLQQAKAIVSISGAELIPSVDGSFGAERLFTDSKDDSNSIDNFMLGLTTSYELDLWGRIRATIKADELDTKAAYEDVATAALTLSAEVARNWYRLVEQRQQLKLLDQQININRDNVAILITRFRGGQATAADIFQQQQLLESVKGDKIIVIANCQVLEHLLAVLLGKPPKMADIPKQGHFPQLASLPNTGLTTELIRRRPDLRNAYFLVQAADQRIAAAIADRFPKISLSASINTSAPDLQSLFNNWMATLAGNLVLPIIDGGRRVAEVERNEAVYAEMLNNYADALLQAVQEVEDALIQEQQQAKLISSLNKQLQLSRLATEQIRSRYAHGAIDFLRLLSALLSQQNLERVRIEAEQQHIEFRINLYRALAGGLPFTFPESQE